MKKSDWALIILIVALVGVASYFIVGALMPSPKDNPQTVPVAASFDSSIVEPSDKIFDSSAINPTVEVTIGNQSNQTPFDDLGE